ncbi:MAG: hypothetical protein HWN65_13385 [Candidatus Helarchaeota archaeon]|nr:hypothetical protein [Candidatus Helarchaeota archaeon]
MSTSVIQKLVGFIKTTELKCACKLVILFSAIKLKDEKGKFDEERLVDFFIEFHRLKEKYKLGLNQECNPLKDQDRKETLQLMNRYPISNLLKEGILKTSESLDSNIYDLIFENQAKILSMIKERLHGHFSETLGDLYLSLNLISEEEVSSFHTEIVEDFLAEWEKGIDEIIKTDALNKLAESHDTISLELLLKYLYQSYDLNSMNELLERFHITRDQFEGYFSSNVDVSKLLVSERIESQDAYVTRRSEAPPATPAIDVTRRPEAPPAAPAAEVAARSEPAPAAPDKVKDLTQAFQQMREMSVEEDYVQVKGKQRKEEERRKKREEEKKRKEQEKERRRQEKERRKQEKERKKQEKARIK